MDCSKCIFAEVESSCQIGCKAKRIDTLVSKDKASLKDGFYQLKQFCNLYRGEDWQNLHGDKATPELARKQVSCNFGVVICDDTSESCDKLQKSLDSVTQAINNYNKKFVKVILSVGLTRDRHNIIEMVNRSQQDDILCEAIIHRFLFDDKIRETEAFNKVSQCGYISMVKSGDELHPNTFNFIDSAINDKLDQFICVKSNNSFIISSHFANSHYLNYKNYEDMEQNLYEICLEKNALGVVND